MEKDRHRTRTPTGGSRSVGTVLEAARARLASTSSWIVQDIARAALGSRCRTHPRRRSSTRLCLSRNIDDGDALRSMTSPGSPAGRERRTPNPAMRRTVPKPWNMPSCSVTASPPPDGRARSWLPASSGCPAKELPDQEFPFILNTGRHARALAHRLDDQTLLRCSTRSSPRPTSGSSPAPRTLAHLRRLGDAGLRSRELATRRERH